MCVDKVRNEKLNEWITHISKHCAFHIDNDTV